MLKNNFSSLRHDEVDEKKKLEMLFKNRNLASLVLCWALDFLVLLSTTCPSLFLLPYKFRIAANEWYLPARSFHFHPAIISMQMPQQNVVDQQSSLPTLFLFNKTIVAFELRASPDVKW